MSVTSPNRTQLLIWGGLTALAPLSIDMYLPAFPAIARDYSVSSGQMAYSLTAYFLGMALGQLLHGPLSDRYGRVRILRFGLLLYLLASLACAFSPSLGGFLAARFVQAFGGCAALVIVRAMVRDQCDSTSAAKIFSRLILIMGLAPMLAPSLGAVVSAAWGWRSVFIALAIYAAIMLALFQRQFQRDTIGEHPFRLRDSANVYVRLLRDQRLMRYLLCSGFSSAAMFAYIAGSPAVFIEHYGLSATQFAWVFGINASSFVICAQLNAWLLRRIPAPRLLHLFQILTVIVALLLTIVAVLDGPFYCYWLPIWIYLGCLGLTQPNAVALAMASQTQHIGSASALIGSIQFALAMVASDAVGVFQAHDGRPLALVILTCTMMALASLLLLKKPLPQ